MRIIPASNKKFEELSVCDFNPIYIVDVSIGLRFTHDIQSETTAVYSDNWYENFLYSVGNPTKDLSDKSLISTPNNNTYVWFNNLCDNQLNNIYIINPLN